MKSRVVTPLIALATVASLGIGWTVFASTTHAQALANYTNDKWHFSLNVPADMAVYDIETTGDVQRILFSDASGDHIFTVLASPYTELDVGTGEEGAPGSNSDQPSVLGVVTVLHEDNVSFSFHRIGVSYMVSSVQPDAQAWLLPILQSWEFTD